MKKILPFLFFSLFCFITEGASQYFVIKTYHVDVKVHEDGYADFEEVINVEFLQPRHGILRAIPYRDKVKGRGTVDRIIKDISVEGHNFSTTRENHNLILRIGDADKYVDGMQTYPIRYRISNPLNFYKDNIEFYWDLLGKSWDTSVEEFTFRITFPEHISLSDADARGWTGAEGSGGTDGQMEVSGNVITGRTTRPFAAYEVLTVAVNLPKDAFARRSGILDFIQVHLLLLIAPFFLLAGILGKVYARNRRQTIMTEFFPPEGVSPVVAGGFVDHSVDNNDVLSLIPHLANKGLLRMEAQEGKGFFAKDNIIFHKMKDNPQGLPAFEEYFFNALFASGNRVELDDLKDKFHTHLTSVKTSVKEWIHLQGWYEADQKKMGCVVALLAFIATAWGGYAIFAKANMDGIVLGAVGLFLFYLSSRFNKRSVEGNKTYQKLEGFRQFVAKAERPVIERLLKEDPLYYDKTMPFALAFGYLKQWNRQFEGLLSQPPSWYTGPMMYGGSLNRSWGNFSENFPSEISSIGSVFSSTPAGSSGGGFSGGGGGFSGGGSGGGGGSSW